MRSALRKSAARSSIKLFDSPRRFLIDLFAPRHLLIILAIVLLVFGTKKLKTIGSDLGASIRGFKRAMKEGESKDELTHDLAATGVTPPAHQPAETRETDKV